MSSPALEEERDFYRNLLMLGSHDDPERFLRAALEALVRLIHAREGYIELRDESEGVLREWSASHGCAPERVDTIRSLVSRGIIADTLATGRIVATAAAVDDPRFADLESVRGNRIEAVLCAPIGRELPIGIVYLQGARTPRIEPKHHEYLELFARSIAPLAERVIHQARAQQARSPEGVIGKSASLRMVLDRLRLAAGLDVTLLLTGASGTGKTLLAQTVHRLSPRRGAFVELNCAAIPETLLENEIFGADEGAHSAVPRGGSIGKVGAAEGGTLFLDEIAELTQASQAKLLQLLQSKTYYRLGGTEHRRANVRVIAATNVELEQAVKEKRFREDLYYRLKVLEVRVPSLSERSEDIVPLAVHFCRDACTRHDIEPKRLSPAALEILRTGEWPGNVRELAHRVETAVLDAHLRGSEVVELVDLDRAPERGSNTPEPETLHEATRRFQRDLLSRTLASVEWNVREAAERLDITRSHIYNLIRTHQLTRGG
jgi:Nif-specific regulatory protein